MFVGLVFVLDTVFPIFVFGGDDEGWPVWTPGTSRRWMLRDWAPEGGLQTERRRPAGTEMGRWPTAGRVLLLAPSPRGG